MRAMQCTKQKEVENLIDCVMRFKSAKNVLKSHVRSEILHKFIEHTEEYQNEKNLIKGLQETKEQIEQTRIDIERAERAADLERAGRSVIHLEVGEPDFDTPRNIVDAAIAALNRGETHYNPSAGIPPLRAQRAALSAT